MEIKITQIKILKNDYFDKWENDTKFFFKHNGVLHNIERWHYLDVQKWFKNGDIGYIVGNYKDDDEYDVYQVFINEKNAKKWIEKNYS